MEGFGKIRRALDGLFQGCYYLAGLLLFILLFLCFATVMSRMLGEPLTWSDEAQRFIMIWMTFIACPVLIVRKEHLVVDLVQSVVKNQRVRNNFYLGGDFLVLAFLIYFLGPCIRMVTMNMIAKSSAMRISMGLVYICMPLGVGLSIVAQAKVTVEHFIELRKAKKGGA